MDRRKVILDLVKDKHRVTVKDVQLVVTGVSSKTLQRELLGMVADGVLRKEGERRWSVYLLRTNGNGNGNGATAHSA
jgi:DeoR/GlpR family transcriptional regulator of sugar metabolism